MNNMEILTPKAEVHTLRKDNETYDVSITYYCPKCGAKIKSNQQSCENMVTKCVYRSECIPYKTLGESACDALNGKCGDDETVECGTKFDWTKRAVIELNPKITWEAHYQTPYNETNYTDRIKSLYAKQQTTKSEE